MNVRFPRILFAGAALGLFAGILAPSAAQAQAQTSGTRFGAEVSLADNSIGLGLGAFGKFHLAEISERAITGRVSFDYYFPSTSRWNGYNYHYWELSGDGLLDIANKNSDIKPYVGAGLIYSRSSGTWCNFYSCSNGDFGLGLLTGVNFMGNSRLMPFIEAKFDLRGGGLFILKGGIHF